MKVHCKGDKSLQYEVIDQGEKYYIVKDFCKVTIANKEDYEPVEEWISLQCSPIYAPTDKYDLRAVIKGGYVTVEGKVKR